jgi:hypothetical protein
MHNHSEEGNCSACQNDGQLSTFDMAYTWKPKFQTDLQQQKPKNKSFIHSLHICLWSTFISYFSSLAPRIHYLSPAHQKLYTDVTWPLCCFTFKINITFIFFKDQLSHNILGPYIKRVSVSPSSKRTWLPCRYYWSLKIKNYKCLELFIPK